MNHANDFSSNIYGVINRDGCHIDVSLTLLGAKQYATRNGYNQVSVRYNGGYTVQVLSTKINGKWENESR